LFEEEETPLKKYCSTGVYHHKVAVQESWGHVLIGNINEYTVSLRQKLKVVQITSPIHYFKDISMKMNNFMTRKSFNKN